METDIKKYGSGLAHELNNILSYWMKYTIDNLNGGFYGSVHNSNIPDVDAPKGAVLNARILWTFSAGYQLTKNKDYLLICERAFGYIVKNFVDKENGGVYWSVDKNGKALDTKKQVYALSFVMYACSEYYKCNQIIGAKQLAIDLYEIIEKYSFDKVNGGYFEAFTVDWKPIADLRLSDKDANEKKTMNTHLHVLEGYANLYSIWPDKNLLKSIQLLLQNFIDQIINKNTFHLDLFFDEDWKNKNNIISYGHDIEAAWLLLEAAEIIRDKTLIKAIKELSIKMTDAAAEGLDKDGGLWYEVENNHLVKEKHWWPQAEAMIGFFNAYQLTNDEKYLEKSIDSWKFTKQFILDNENGEWFWGVNEDYSIMQGYDKAGFWKCPYHNGRACLEIIKRIQFISVDVLSDFITKIDRKID